MSENDMLIEMRRLRRELGGVRAGLSGMGRRPSSFEHRPVTSGRLRRRATAAMLAALAMVFALTCWLIYSALHAIMGGVFDGIVPEPGRVTVNTLADLLAALL